MHILEPNLFDDILCEFTEQRADCFRAELSHRLMLTSVCQTLEMAHYDWNVGLVGLLQSLFLRTGASLSIFFGGISTFTPILPLWSPKNCLRNFLPEENV